jgi:hypothetical protein
MIYALIAYLAAAILALGGKDADSYQLKARQDDGLTVSRVKRWHRDGVILFLLIVALAAWKDLAEWYKVAIAAGLLRLSLFDLAFNYWAGGLSIHYLGGTAWWDRQMVKIFGINGAVLKASIFLTILIALIVANKYFL